MRDETGQIPQVLSKPALLPYLHCLVIVALVADRVSAFNKLYTLLTPTVVHCTRTVAHPTLIILVYFITESISVFIWKGCPKRCQKGQQIS